MTMPLAVPNQPQQLQEVNEAANLVGFSIGVVKAWGSRTMKVTIAGSTVLQDAAYLRSYPPILGDYVLVVRNDASWTVIGSLSAKTANNQVLNHSFEDDLAGTAGVPSKWGWYHDPASTANNVSISTAGTQPPFIDGTQAAYVTVADSSGVGSKRSIDYLYSSAITVSPGVTGGISDIVTAAAFGRLYGGEPSNFTHSFGKLGVYAYFFSDPAAIPPNQIGTSPGADQAFSGSNPNWAQLTCGAATDGVVVPPGAVAMRVVLKSDITINAAVGTSAIVSWDNAIGRKV